MELKLHNTLTGQKDPFKPIHHGEVSMYHCGPTVYNFAHIGNMRSYVLADTLRRTFEYFGYKVNQVINITDVGHLVGDGDEGEDKVEKAAKKEGKTAEEIAEFYEKAFKKDLEALNIETKGTKFPRASKHIKEQLEIIEVLEKRGFAYSISDGIYFDTSKFPDYGKLGNINTEGMKEGARVKANNEKRNQIDFALWKFSSSTSSGQSSEKRLQEWQSPWGVGFPGWHIECSAMSRKYLNQPFDIHTGGVDHIPTHHNNEIAQSECAFDVPLANFWLHNEFLTVLGEKMAKILGNTFTISDLKVRKIHPLSFRYWLLTGNYGIPLNFTWEAIGGAQVALEKIVSQYSELSKVSEVSRTGLDSQNSLNLSHKKVSRTGLDTLNVLDTLKKFEEAISDNLNTPIVISLLQKAESKQEMDKMDKVLGLNIKKLSEMMRDIPGEILNLQKERDLARENKDFAKSDSIRSEIESKGFRVNDTSLKTVILRSISGLI